MDTTQEDKLIDVIYFYDRLYTRVYGVRPRQPRDELLRRFLSPLLKSYTTPQICALMFVYFDWRGLDGKDDYIYQRLYSKGFPLTWLAKEASIYETYIRQTLGVDMDNPKELARVLDKWNVLMPTMEND